MTGDWRLATGDWKSAIVAIILSRVGGKKAPDVGMLGSKGTRTASTTVLRGRGRERLDFENPNPGQRAGQVHYQDNDGNKYLYNSSTDSFDGASRGVNDMLDDPGFRRGLEKAMRQYLGEN